MAKYEATLSGQIKPTIDSLEVLIVKGKAKKIREIADKLISTKGVKYGRLTAATSGKELT